MRSPKPSHKIRTGPHILRAAKNLRGSGGQPFDVLDPRRTAHVVIDMQNGFFARGAQALNIAPGAAGIVPFDLAERHQCAFWSTIDP